MLNTEQSKGLANFFFDVAKGLILGGIGFSISTSPEVRILAILLSSVMTYICIRLALLMLENTK